MTSAVYVLPGMVLAGIGFVILFVLLASVDALAKSRQLAAAGHLASGRAGPGKRVLFFIAVALLVVGALLSFAGVAASDARRTRVCTETCIAKGHRRGVIGPSKEKHPQRPSAAAFVACACTGGTAPPVELRADSL